MIRFMSPIDGVFLKKNKCRKYDVVLPMFIYIGTPGHGPIAC